MAILFTRANDALAINPQSGNEQLSTNGSNWLWAATAIYIVSFLTFFGTSYVARSGEKIFHYLFTIALFVGSISYYAQASGLAYVDVLVQNSRPTDPWVRQIFWAKYVNWVVAFPVVNIALGLLSGVSWATIFYNVSLSWVWIISYLVSALTISNYKWGFYAFGTISWIILAVNTFVHGGAGAKRVGVARDHSILAGWANFLWLLYPIAFGLSDGGNKIGVTPAFVFFGVLDLLLVPGLAFGFLLLSRNWDYSRLNIAFTRYGRVAHGTGEYPEKATATPAHAPAVEGTHNNTTAAV